MRMRIVTCLSTTLALALLATPATADRVADADFTYDGIGKRDPFRSAVVGPGTQVSTKLFGQYDLEQLALTAVIEAPDAGWAVVQGPAGFHAVVTTGSRFGSDRMRVVGVTADALVLEDFRFSTEEGVPVTLRHELKLAAAERALPETPPGP